MIIDVDNEMRNPSFKSLMRPGMPILNNEKEKRRSDKSIFIHGFLKAS
jgi:hypothetical protein